MADLSIAFKELSPDNREKLFALIEDPEQIDPEVVDAAANLALESFVPLFEGMMRTSQFID